MELSLPALALLLAYKVLIAASGYGCVRLGFSLFKAGMFGDAGELNATFSNNSLLVKKAAPGTFFVVLGAVIILSVIWREVRLPVGLSRLSEPTETSEPVSMGIDDDSSQDSLRPVRNTPFSSSDEADIKFYTTPDVDSRELINWLTKRERDSLAALLR